jgi:hypothetical protein
MPGAGKNPLRALSRPFPEAFYLFSAGTTGWVTISARCKESHAEAELRNGSTDRVGHPKWRGATSALLSQTYQNKLPAPSTAILLAP